MTTNNLPDSASESETQTSQPADRASSTPFWRTFVLGLIVWGGCCWYFSTVPPVPAKLGAASPDETEFTDEAAHVAGTNYFHLLWQGQMNHPDWLYLAAHDHLPVYKYILGAWLSGNGKEIPTTTAAYEQWQQDNRWRPQDETIIPSARLPILAAAALGCLLLFWLGWRLQGFWTGLTAMLLLLASPLYSMLAHRAMGDVLVQTFGLFALWATIVWLQQIQLLVQPGSESLIEPASLTPGSWPRFLQSLLWVLLAGLMLGLAVGTKLNGVVLALTLALWLILMPLFVFLVPPRQTEPWINGLRWRGTLALAGVTIIGLIAVGTFLASNPYFFAQPDLTQLELTNEIPPGEPITFAGTTHTAAAWRRIQQLQQQTLWQRVQHLWQYRTETLAQAQAAFPNDHLAHWSRRWEHIVGEGMVRWSFLNRFAGLETNYRALGAAKEEQPRNERAPALGWYGFALFCALTGLWRAGREGWRRLRLGLLPLTWLLFLWPIVEVAILMRQLTLDWDRYYLGITVWFSLLTAYSLFGNLNWFGRQLMLDPEADQPTV